MFQSLASRALGSAAIAVALTSCGAFCTPDDLDDDKLFCNPTCQSVCNKVYSEQYCGIVRPGKDQDELISDCIGYCEEALSEPGELGTYDPYERVSSSTSVNLDNERQAALWMDCVSEQSCTRLGQGYCAPIW
jgi:hypothetical protein